MSFFTTEALPILDRMFFNNVFWGSIAFIKQYRLMSDSTGNLCYWGSIALIKQYR